MNLTSVVSDSSRDVMMAALMVTAELDEAWFAKPSSSLPPPMSSRPPPVVHVGEFLGDPEVDAWLR